MKKIFLLCLVFILVLTLVNAAVPDIDVTLLNQDPDPVKQGEVVEVRFKVENVGTSTLDNVDVEFLPSYPFTLYSGDLIKELGKIPPSQTGADAIIIDYKLKVDEFAVEGETEVELKIRLGDQVFFYDDDEYLIDIEEYDIPEIKAYLRETTILQPNSRGTITIEIANIGEADIKFLQLSLLPNDEYKLISSSNYVYLGDIDSDDIEREDFDIFVKDIKNGKVTIPVLLQYEDVEEKNYEEEYEVTFEVYDSTDIYKYGIKKRGYTTFIIIAVILLIIGYFYWKRKKR